MFKRLKSYEHFNREEIDFNKGLTLINCKSSANLLHKFGHKRRRLRDMFKMHNNQELSIVPHLQHLNSIYH